MKKIIKPVLAAVLAVLILQTYIPAAAANTYGYDAQATNASIQNLAGTSPAAADFTASSYQSLIETIARQYIARDPDFTVRYNASLSEVQSRLSTGSSLFDDIFAVDIPGTTSDLDYLDNNMSKMSVSWRYSGTYAICTFTQTYLTTASQENYVNTSVNTILSKLDTGDNSAYGKIRAVHDYIINNVEYDYSYSKYTAYDALDSHKTVCQGYALLMYKLLKEAGIPVRIVSGEAAAGGRREAHAWNIVKIGQSWYNVDVTWDDTSDQTKYLLKNNASFADHYRDTEFNTSAFNAAHPMSALNFDLTQDAKLVSSISLIHTSGSTYTIGGTFTLSAQISPSDATNPSLSWSTSNPSVATVNSTGTVTVKGSGTAVIRATANDGTGKTAAYTIYVPDAPSIWASNEVNALGARGVIPAELRSSYQDSISRAEFMALIANIYKYAKGAYTPAGGLPFTDISVSAYKDEISLGYELGIICGTGETTFSPDNTLTREQCAKIISAAVGAINQSPVSSTANLPFGDVTKISGWALPYIRYAYEKGLMTGNGESFDPLGILTREQAMLIAERMIVKYGW